jgi:hypothetical protein
MQCGSSLAFSESDFYNDFWPRDRMLATAKTIPFSPVPLIILFGRSGHDSIGANSIDATSIIEMSGQEDILPRAIRGDGRPVQPGDGIVPIVKELSRGYLSVVGTGFYVTRYGLLVTAKHVVEELVNEDGASLGVSFVFHLAGEKGVHLRKLCKAHILKASDVAVVQADNYLHEYPNDPLMNLRGHLSTSFPAEGAPLVTFAYPENKVLNFEDKDAQREVRGDFFEGGFLRYVHPPENPLLKFPYFETTIPLRPGASGGPVFYKGRIIGINCAGWDFRGAEHEGHSLSYIVPIEHLMKLEVDPFMVPPQSWEAQQIPPDYRGKSVTVSQLAQFGHILLNGDEK